MSLGPCQRCNDKEALAIVYGATGEDDEAVKLCVMCCTAFVAPLVLHTLAMHHEHLTEVHGLSSEEAAKAVALMASAIEDGNTELLMVPICHIMGLDLAQHEAAAPEAAPEAAPDDDSQDIIQRIIDGTIDPGDFMK